MPSTCKSMPPAARIDSSYRAQYAGMSPARPSGDVHTFLVDVDLTKQVLPHEAVITGRVIRRQADVLVEIECFHPTPVQLHRHQLTVQQQRRAAGGQSQHQTRAGAQLLRNDPCGRLHGIRFVRANDHFHGLAGIFLRAVGQRQKDFPRRQLRLQRGDFIHALCQRQGDLTAFSGGSG